MQDIVGVVLGSAATLALHPMPGYTSKQPVVALQLPRGSVFVLTGSARCGQPGRRRRGAAGEAGCGCCCPRHGRPTPWHRARAPLFI